MTVIDGQLGRNSRDHEQPMARPIEAHVRCAIAMRRPAFEKLPLAGIELKDQIGPRVAYQQLTVVIHGHFREMPGSISRSSHIGDELIDRAPRVACSTPTLS